jgi:hypothetical protein
LENQIKNVKGRITSSEEVPEYFGAKRHLSLKNENIMCDRKTKTSTPNLSETFNKPCLECSYLAENVKHLFNQKVVQIFTISLSYFFFSKNRNDKVAQLVKNRPIGEKSPNLVTLFN